MYKDNSQISILEFISPFGELDPENRWVKIANLIPWKKYESKYKKQFCVDNGAPAIPFRMAMGTLIIKQQTDHSDEDVLQDILENPYKQFLIGLHEFTKAPPFSARSITNFRKYITAEMLSEINNELFRAGREDTDNNNDDIPPTAGDKSEEEPSNKGTLILDATCAPADIAYPTDINLLNEAREKLETMIDTLQPQGCAEPKPRTYRRKARKEYLRFIKQKKPGYDKARKAIGQQLRYVKRNLGHTVEMMQKYGAEALSSNQKHWLETIKKLYEQQLFMYETRTHRVDDRIVSISQPHVRPIVRGKMRTPVEFGAKVSISLVGGYAFPDIVAWNNYNEEVQLIPAIEAYKKHNGRYPERVLADTLYRNKTNRDYCKERGIRLSGPALGRPSKETDKALLKQQSQDACDRSPIEGKFGEGKAKFGLGRVMARIQESCETVIYMAFLCMNINRRLRVLLRFFQSSPYLGMFWAKRIYSWVFA